MATMRFKNKYDVAFKQMVLEAEKIDGIPKEIIVTPKEMWGVINEMRWSEMSYSRFRVTSLTGSDQEFTIRRTFWSAYSDLPIDEANEVLVQIAKGKFTIEYGGIPLKIEREHKFTNPAHADKQPRKSWWESIFRRQSPK